MDSKDLTRKSHKIAVLYHDLGWALGEELAQQIKQEAGDEERAEGDHPDSLMMSHILKMVYQNIEMGCLFPILSGEAPTRKVPPKTDAEITAVVKVMCRALGITGWRVGAVQINIRDVMLGLGLRDLESSEGD